MSADLVIPAGQEAEQRLPIGLLVKTGDKVPTASGTSERPRALDHFRFTAGELNQYTEAAAKAMEFYGMEPHELDDVLFLSNRIADVLDIRIRAWGTSGPRIIGKTNFAAIDDKDEYLRAVEAWDDEILFYPKDESEVHEAMREAWQGEPISSRLKGPDDARIEKYTMKVSTTLRFGLPQVLGMGKIALYSTTSRNNRDNLRDALWFAYQAFRGNLIGIRFRLAVRPRRARYFDKEKRARITTNTYEVVLDTPFTLQEAIDAIREQREALGQGTGPERLALPAPVIDDKADFFNTDEREQTEATEVPVVPVEAFDPELRDAEPEPVEGEVVEENISFEDLLPASVKKARK